MFHMILHFIVPLAISVIFFRQNCIGFRHLHKVIPIGIYFLLSAIPKTRLVGIGLLIHMGLDSIDCKINTGDWIHQL